MATSQLTNQTLREDVQSDSALRVDREAGVIKGVKVLGLKSKNGRRYTEEAARGAIPKYEDAEVNVDHPERGSESRERKMSEGYGILKGVHWEARANPDDSGLFGNINYLKSHPQAETIAERAERFPETFGLSHVAVGDVKDGLREGDEAVVESIVHVESVDVVRKPATNRGLFESENRPVTKTITKRKVRDILEGKKSNKLYGNTLKVLTEMEDMAAVGDAEVEAPAEDPNAEVQMAMEKAAVGIVKKLFAGDVEATDAFKKIKELLGMKDKASDDSGTETPTPEPVAESVRELMEEVKQMKRDRLTEQVLTENGHTRSGLTESQKSLLAKQADEDSIRELVESWPKPQPRGYDGPAFSPRPRIGSAVQDTRREPINESYDDLKKRVRPKPKARA